MKSLNKEKFLLAPHKRSYEKAKTHFGFDGHNIAFKSYSQ